MRPPVCLDVLGEVATVKIDRPPLNLLSAEVKLALTETFESCAARHDIRVIVLCATGERAFSAGADIREFPERIRLGNAAEVARSGHRMAASIRECPQPVIAAIDGVAFGAGLEIALCADLRIASARSMFAFPEIRRGVFPGNAGSQLLPRLVSLGRAKELMLTGDPVDAATAERIGLVNRIVADGELLSEARRLAGDLARRPAATARFIKQLVDEGAELPLPAALELETELFAEVFRGQDVREGAAAFLEKRQPDFTTARPEER
ncbi:enoyl-CoA hydratase-related protein [Saccharopolyspora sp. WRP15-2]|uniref:Enoyl-CoA hydratase-related protein n=1 Tax=Saccharopolyspora oryzae TaxID=2997343 RepID=A0ABT4V9K6_9PSEU|nr:enoyl-CoA hydratase-related protein [Saccharopolyspora oryzae]MDA3630641.1 enoyl-CoA hydratase-related protein [Saccharopolyspora oryzae]